jgi:hypothetical protein
MNLGRFQKKSKGYPLGYAVRTPVFFVEGYRHHLKTFFSINLSLFYFIHYICIFTNFYDQKDTRYNDIVKNITK